MATIKEVAAYAGVSVGTVSNVLNGNTNNVELIERVENAMKELAYRPDANARKLKNSKSNVVAVILPNIMHPDLQTFLSTIEADLREKGYSLLLKISQNNPILEGKCIEQCLEQSVDGIIIYSSSGEYLSELIPATVPIVFINQQIKSGFLVDSIMIDYEKALKKAIQYFSEQGVLEVGIIIENNLIPYNKMIAIYQEYYENIENVKIVDFSKERGFKAAYELLYDNKKMGALITSNYMISEGAKKAISLLKRSDISLVAFKEENWIEDENNYVATIGISYKKVAGCAVKKIINAIEKPNIYEPITEYFEAEYIETTPLLSNITKKAERSKKLKLALFDCPAAHSLKMLAEIYKEQTAIEIEIEMLKYNQLKNCLHTLPKQEGNCIDGFMMDITWIDELIDNKIIYPINEYLGKPKEYFHGFVGEVVQEYGMKKQLIYGIPFMSGTQLLFYQKDLFESQGLKRLFKRMYGEELVPPKTWASFNLVAEFFTREFNEKSPVKFGISAVQGENVFTSISFLNRLWSYGSDVFGVDGTVTINDRNALSALKSFIKSYQFVSKERVNITWDDVVEEFSTGDCAMAVLYDSHAVGINDYTKSKVAGNIGYSLVPGQTPVLGGWSLGVNENSENKKDVIDFMLWVCSDQSAIPNYLLGGTTLRENYYNRNDLENLYPWKSLLIDSYKISRKRIIVKSSKVYKNEKDIYNNVISKAINNVIIGNYEEEEALQMIEMQLNDLI